MQDDQPLNPALQGLKGATSSLTVGRNSVDGNAVIGPPELRDDGNYCMPVFTMTKAGPYKLRVNLHTEIYAEAVEGAAGLAGTHHERRVRPHRHDLQHRRRRRHRARLQYGLGSILRANPHRLLSALTAV